MEKVTKLIPKKFGEYALLSHLITLKYRTAIKLCARDKHSCLFACNSSDEEIYNFDIWCL